MKKVCLVSYLKRFGNESSRKKWKLIINRYEVGFEKCVPKGSVMKIWKLCHRKWVGRYFRGCHCHFSCRWRCSCSLVDSLLHDWFVCIIWATISAVFSKVYRKFSTAFFISFFRGQYFCEGHLQKWFEQRYSRFYLLNYGNFIWKILNIQTKSIENY